MSTDDEHKTRQSPAEANDDDHEEDHLHRVFLSFPSHPRNLLRLSDDHHHECHHQHYRGFHDERILACESMIQLASNNKNDNENENNSTNCETASNDAPFPPRRPKDAPGFRLPRIDSGDDDNDEMGAKESSLEVECKALFAEEDFDDEEGVRLTENYYNAGEHDDDDDAMTAFLRNVDYDHHDLEREWNAGVGVPAEVHISLEDGSDENQKGDTSCEEKEELHEDYESEYSDSDSESEGAVDDDYDDGDDYDDEDDSTSFEQDQEAGRSGVYEESLEDRYQAKDRDPVQDIHSDDDDDEEEEGEEQDDVTTDSCSSTSASGSSNSSCSFDTDGKREIKKQPPPHELFLPNNTAPTFERLKYEEDDDDSSDDSDSSDDDDEFAASSPPRPQLSLYPHRTYMVRPRMMLPTRQQRWNAQIHPFPPLPGKSGQPKKKKAKTNSRTSNGKDRVSFHSAVTVYPVFHTSSYPPSLLSKMYTQRDELRINKSRNKREYAYDMHDWRNATEEDDMSEGSDGELVHPVHPVHRVVGVGTAKASVASLVNKRAREKSIVGTDGNDASAGVGACASNTNMTAVHRDKRIRMYYP